MPGEVPEGRAKPWGTGQAVLAEKDLIHEPFAVINVDDYYGKEAYRQMHDWLVLEHADNAIAMVGLRIPRMISLIWSEGRSAGSSTVTSRICSVIWVGGTAAVFGELGESSSNWTDSCCNNALLIFRCQL